MTHGQPPRRVWGRGTRGDPRVLRTYLRRLQRKPDGDADDPTYNLHQAAHRLLDAEGEDGGRRNCMSEERHTSEDIEDGGTE